MPVKPEIQRRNILTIRVRDHELETVNQAADLLRISVTEFHRDAVLARARHVLKQNAEAPSGR